MNVGFRNTVAATARPGRVNPWSVGAMCVLIVGAVLRLARLDLMEFKGDEAEALNLGIRLLSDRPWSSDAPWPQHGMLSSQHVANAPLFNWLMAGAWALTGDPVGATALVAAANALSLLPLWRWATRQLDSERALLLTATMAVSPFTVIFSRKLWAQDLLLPGLVCLLWSIERWREGRSFLSMALFAVAVLLIGQLHQSGPVALAVFPLAAGIHAWRHRPQLPPQRLGFTALSPVQFGVLAVLIAVHSLLWLPYIAYLTSLPPDILSNRARLPDFRPALLLGVVNQIVPRDFFYFFHPDQADFLGDPLRRVSYTIAVVFAVPLLVVGVWGWIRRPSRLPVLGIWWWLVIGVFTILRIPTYPFYVLVLSPLPAALVSGAFDGLFTRPWIERTLLLWRWAYVAALFCLTTSTGWWLSQRGGAKGDYGIAYAVREQQARAVAESVDPTRMREARLQAPLVCHEPVNEVRWIGTWVHGAQATIPSVQICDGWIRQGAAEAYRWTVAR
jgi:Dolichyl-phosphate-mannose-protein mannosyltransferase